MYPFILEIDGNTLILVNALLSAASAMVMYAVYSVNRHADGLRYWASSNLCFATGFALLLGVAFDMSDFVSVLVANVFIDVGTVLAYVAALQFLGRPRATYRLIVPALMLIATQIVLYSVNGVDMRTIVVLGATARAILTIGAGWQLLRHAEAKLRPASTLSAIAHFLWAAMLAGRVAWWLLSQFADVGIDPTTPPALLSRILLTFVVTPSYLWMVTRQLDFELIRQAREDALTGIANRRAIWEQGPRLLASAVRDRRSGGLLMIDIDNFKQINDRFGHAMGDKVLVSVASILAEQVRERDLVGRIGGEEFMVMLPDIGFEDAMNIAERLRTSVSRHAFLLDNGSRLCCTVSIGLCPFEGHSRDWERLVQAADAALYCAKGLGRNCVEAAPPLEAVE